MADMTRASGDPAGSVKEEYGMTEVLTADRVRMVIAFSKGALEPYVPDTAACLTQLGALRVRARANVDVATERIAIRRRAAAGDVSPEAALRELRAVEKSAAVTEDQAAIADFTAARLERDIPGVFRREVEQAWPKMRSAFDEALRSFVAAVANVPIGVDDDAKASSKGGTVGRSWLAACEAQHACAALWKAANDLREAHLLPSVPLAHSSEFLWADPSKVPARRGFNGMPLHRVAFMRAAVAAGAGPALLEAEEVRVRMAHDAAANASKRQRDRVGSACGFVDPQQAVLEAIANAQLHAREVFGQ